MEVTMISSNPAFDQFVSDHRWAVLTALRSGGAPVSSVVAYAREDDSLVISTPGGTFKRRLLEADGRCNLCVMTNSEPFNFVAIEGKASIETQNIKASTVAVFENIADTGYELPSDLDGWLTQQKRVILRIAVERVHGVIR
ncbi:MAG: PPOX class probable F420-dependent enzyme [Candidatus Azotimanducaceae bacterium]|jgi:PPOX class probable F420-dependent enzyme